MSGGKRGGGGELNISDPPARRNWGGTYDEDDLDDIEEDGLKFENGEEPYRRMMGTGRLVFGVLQCVAVCCSVL